MWKFYTAVLTSALLSLMTAQTQANDLLISGGTIHASFTTAQPVEALLMRDGKVLAAGSLKDIQALTKAPTLLDLKGKTLVPGFIDSHVHVRELGMDAVKADLVGAETVADIVERLKAFYPTPMQGQWLIGQGWDEGKWASLGYPDRAALDAAFPDNPVALESLHGFGGFYNASALALAGVTKDSKDPEGGTILRRPNGEPTGVMLTLAQDLVNRHIPPLSLEDRKDAILAGLNIMATEGVTSIHEAGMTREDLAAFQQLRAEGRLPIRVYGMLNGNDSDLMREWFARGPLSDPQTLLEIRGIKVFYDGSLGSRTAMLAAPYSDHPEKANPTERITPKAVSWLARQAAETGFQMAVHAIGDEGNNRTLKIYEHAIKGDDAARHRWRVEHAQVVLPDFYTRAAALGLIASVQSSHAVGDSGWAEDRLGKARIHHAYAWQKLLKAGIYLALNSDLPGEPWTPVETLYFAVNRQNLDGQPAAGWYAEEALTPKQALKAMTIVSAYAAYQDTVLGDLMPGKWADFVILDRDPLTTKPQDLKDIQVLGTWVSGKKAISTKKAINAKKAISTKKASGTH